MEKAFKYEKYAIMHSVDVFYSSLLIFSNLEICIALIS